MTRSAKKPLPLIVGRPALVMIDFQRAMYLPGSEGGIPHMGGAEQRVPRARALVDAARKCGVPVIFIQEVHRPDLIDFGRGLDGQEDVHCIEGHRLTEIAAEGGDFRPGDYFVPKRRYSAFFGTDFEILLKGLEAETLILTGGSPMSVSITPSWMDTSKTITAVWSRTVSAARATRRTTVRCGRCNTCRPARAAQAPRCWRPSRHWRAHE
jgi:isochorismate hydrolase